MSDQFSPSFNSEDFEKVDPDSYAEQDENVTSSSLPGEMAEEDRYGTTEQDDLLGDFTSSGSVTGNKIPDSMSSGEPLIEFDNGAPESTVTASAPAESELTAPKKETSPAAQSEGCWMKNVDPRDEGNLMSEPAVTVMDEQPDSAATADTSAVAAATGQPSREVNAEDQDSLSVDPNISNTVIDSESSEEYSGEEYSSSADESDSEHSDMESSENEGTYNMNPEQDENMECESFAEHSAELADNLDVSNVNNVEEKTINVDNSFENEFRNLPDQIAETVDSTEMELLQESVPKELIDVVEDGSSRVEQLPQHDDFDKDSDLPDDNIECACKEETLSEGISFALQAENTDDNSVLEEKEEVEKATLPISDDLNDHEDEDAVEMNKALHGEQTYELESTESITEEISQDTEEDSVSEYRTMGMSEDEMSKLLEKLTGENEEECIDSVEQDKFLDNIEPPVFEKISESVLCNENSSDESVGSESEQDDSSIDSDISGDEPVMGVWNPSPLHANLDSVSEDFLEGEPDEAAKSAILSGYTYSENEDENKNRSTKEPATTADETADQCHVKFQSPTNTIFYDPESPIIERVSIQVSDDLIDFDDESRGLSKKEETKQPDPVEPCDSEVSKDPLSFNLYKDESDEELQGAMELIQDTGLEELKVLASQIRGGNRSEYLKSEPDVPKNEQLSAEPQIDTSKDIDAEVVLRRKNHKNVAEECPEQDRSETGSMIIHDIDMPDELTNEYQRAVESAPFSNVDMISVESKVIDEEANTLLNEAMTNLDEMIPDVEGTEEKTETIIHKDKVDTDTEELDKVLQNNEDILEEIAEGHAQHPESPTNDIDKRPEVEQIENLASKIASNIMESINTESQSKYSNTVTETEGIEDLSHGIEDLSHIESTEDIEELNEDESESATCFETSMETTMVEADLLEEKAELDERIVEKLTKSEKSGIITIHSNEEQVEDQIDEMEVAEPIVASIEEEKMTDPVVYKKRERCSFSEQVAAMVMELSSEVLEIIYWRDVKKTGVVFGSMMFVLLSLALFSLMSVLAYLSLAILTVTFSFRVYKSVMQAVQKTNDGHPFNFIGLIDLFLFKLYPELQIRKLLDLDIELREDVVEGAAQKIADNINNCSRELRRLYLVGDYIDSLKFGLLLWLMTYVGCWFNGMTLIILVVVSIFTLPKVYETYQGPIDQNVNLVRAQLNNIMAQVSAKIPFPKKKAKTQ